MNTNDLYYKKYLKYKSKYLELKGSGQIGGVLKPCPRSLIFTSPYELIKNHDCKYPQLEKKFNDFTYAKFLAANGRHPTKLLTIQELKDKGFPLDFFIDHRGDPYPPRKYPRNILIAPYIQEIKNCIGLRTLNKKIL